MPKHAALMMLTRWVSGNISASCCAQTGRLSTGKNVPLKRNIGVMKRKIGRLYSSMLLTMPVKNMPIAPKARPPKNDSGKMSKPAGYVIRPNMLITVIIIMVAAIDFVAAQIISPAIISLRNSGVAIIASKVF